MNHDLLSRIETLLEQRDERAAFSEACALFNSIDDDETFRVALDRFPGLMNYGPRGEWQGACRYENGWSN